MNITRNRKIAHFLDGLRNRASSTRPERAEQWDPSAIPVEIAPKTPKNRTSPNFAHQRGIKPN